MEETRTWKINKKKYSAKYQKDFYATTVLHFNKKYEADAVAWLESQPNKSEYIRRLIVNDMNANKK